MERRNNIKLGLIRAYLPPERGGGSEIRTMLYAQKLAERGYEVYVFSRKLEGKAFKTQKDGFTIVYRKALKIPKIRFVWDIVKFLHDAKLLKGKKSILIAYNFIIPGIQAVLANEIHKLPYMVWVRDNYSYRFDKNPIKKFIIKTILRKAKKIIFQTNHNRVEFLKYIGKSSSSVLYYESARKSEVVIEGIDKGAMKKNKGNYVLYVGRLDPIKGVDILIRAFKELPGEVELLIVGDGPERKKLEALVSVANNVSILGSIPHEDVMNLMDNALFLVLPSYSEGFPNVVLESMARGLPVIATNVGGLPALVEDGKTGLLVPPGDVERLREAMEYLIKNDEARCMMGRNAYERVELFSWEDTLRKLEDIIKSVLT